jgi:DHA1 family tetracycline resistance protein-like MFS transporter
MLVDALSYSLILPALPDILRSYDAGAFTAGFLIASHAAAAALSAPALGWLSDRWGRRPIILATVAGAAVSYGLFAFAPGLIGLFLARLLSGIMAGNLGVVQAAATEGCDKQTRTKALGMLTAAMALGFVLGPGLSALAGLAGLASRVGLGLLAVVACIVALITVHVLYRPELSEPADALNKSPPETDVTSKRVGYWIGVNAVAAFAQTGLVSMTAFWAAQMFAWGPTAVGLLFLWVSLFIVVGQIAIAPVLGKHMSTLNASIICLLAWLLGVGVLMLFPRVVGGLLIGGPVLFVAITLLQTFCTLAVSEGSSPSELGARLGVLSSAASIARVIGPLTCGYLFSHVDPRAPYALAAAVGTISLLLLLVKLRWPDRSTPSAV